MTQENINYINANKKFPFKISDILNRYLVLIYPCFITLLGITILISEGDKGLFALISIVIILIGLYLFRNMWEGIEVGKKFYSIYTNVTDSKLINECIITLGWEIRESTSKYVIGGTKLSLTSWGQMITIILNDGELLFNSRPDEESFTSKRDVNNFWIFFELIEKIEQDLSF